MCLVWPLSSYTPVRSRLRCFPEKNPPFLEHLSGAPGARWYRRQRHPREGARADGQGPSQRNAQGSCHAGEPAGKAGKARLCFLVERGERGKGTGARQYSSFFFAGGGGKLPTNRAGASIAATNIFPPGSSPTNACIVALSLCNCSREEFGFEQKSRGSCMFFQLSEIRKSHQQKESKQAAKQARISATVQTSANSKTCYGE